LFYPTTLIDIIVELGFRIIKTTLNVFGLSFVVLTLGYLGGNYGTQAKLMKNSTGEDEKP